LTPHDEAYAGNLDYSRLSNFCGKPVSIYPQHFRLLPHRGRF
jgi:hypothetical protein